MKKYIFILAILAQSLGTAIAADGMSAMDAFNAGKDFANSGKDAAKGKINAGTGSEALPYYGTAASETQHFQNGRNIIGGVGTQKITDCKTYQAGNEFAQQECDAVNYLSKLPTSRPQYSIDKNTDPLIIGSDSIINNPPSIPGSTTNQCRVETVITPGTFTEETCTEANAFTTNKCNRRLIVNCEFDQACALGGIVPNSWAGDMSSSFTPDGSGNYILQFGTIANDYWPTGVYDRTLVFDINNVEKVMRFALSYAAFDDWLLVKINDHTVYVGPYGGDRLELIGTTIGLPVDETGSYCTSGLGQWSCRDSQWGGGASRAYSRCTGGVFGQPRMCYLLNNGQVQNCANCYRNVELKTSWAFGLNVDLRPYLLEGENKIFMRTIVGGLGEGAIRITTQQQCPMNCTDTWDESECAQLKELSK